MITLYVDGFFVSPLDASCMIALTEKGIEFHTARALLRDGQGVPPSLGIKTLIPRVPAIQHGEFYLSESLAIIEYLEDAFPPPYPRLLPAEPRARARARQVMSYLRCDLQALREERQWWTCIYPAVELPPMSPRALRDASDLLDFSGRVIGELAEWSIAQTDLAIQLMRLTRGPSQFDVPDDIRRFVDTAIERPSVKTYLAHQRPPHPPARSVGYG